jgi:hypothetical protein
MARTQTQAHGKTKALKPKKTCCHSSPRCRRCPVVLKRLRRAGHAEQDERGRTVLRPDVPKKAIKRARRTKAKPKKH